jgi:peptide/nickel transport system substrate-binding protein
VAGGTLTVATGADLDSLDPLRYFTSTAGVFFRNLTDTLVRFGPDLQPAPGLAERWEVSPDGRRYTFHLRDGVTFHDGTAFDAEAVRFVFLRYLNDKGSPWHQDVAYVQDVEVVDRLTARVALAHPYAAFLSKLVLGAGIMVSPAAVQKLGEGLRRDFTGAGTGPWRFGEWHKDSHFTAVRNDRYWERDAHGTPLPYLDKLVFRVVPDENTRLAYLKTGEVDALASYLGGPPAAQVAAIRRDPDLVYREEPGFSWTAMDLNVGRAPFDKQEVRQALALAVDRESIVRTVLHGVEVPSDTVLPPTQPGHDPGFRPYLKRDVARARALLQRAGQARVAFTFQTSNSGQQPVAIAELIKDQIAPAGFEMKIELLDPAARRARREAGDFQASLGSWSGFIDPDGNVYQLFHGANAQNATNCCRFGNPALDRLLDQGRQTLDPAARAAIYRQVDRLLAEDSPTVILYHGVNSVATSKRVQNFPLGTAAIIRFGDVWRNP